MKVAIHNKNGKGLLLNIYVVKGTNEIAVAIHNKNGKGLLHIDNRKAVEGFTGRNPQ